MWWRSYSLGALLWCSLAGLAWADGGLFFQSVADAGTSGDQRGIVLFDGTQETLILQTVAQDPQSGYAWIIPTPHVVPVDGVTQVDSRVFDDMDYLTAPVIVDDTAPGYSGGMKFGGCAAGGLDGAGNQAVTVWGTTRVGDYEVSALTATDSAALTTWLTDRGYALPAAAEAVLARYIHDEWAFTAVRVATLPAERSKLTVDPLALTFPVTRAVFPLVISTVSTATDQESVVQLYVLADSHVDATPYDTVPLDTSELRGTEAFDAYAERVREQSTSGDPAFVVEFSGFVPAYSLPGALAGLPGLPNVAGSQTDETGAHVTRVRAHLTSADMFEDVVFTVAPDNAPNWDQVWWSGVPALHYAGTGAPPAPAGLAPGVVLGICVGAICRGKPRRRLACGIVAMVLVILAVM